MKSKNVTEMHESTYGHWRGALAVLLNSFGEAKILQRFKSEKSYAWKVQTIDQENGEINLWRVTAPAKSTHGLAKVELIKEGETNNG